MNNGKRPNQSDISRLSWRLGQTKPTAKRKDMPGWQAFLVAMGASRARGFFSRSARLRLKGLGATEIAKRLNIGRASVYRVLAA
jgi:hypothetical protein